MDPSETPLRRFYEQRSRSRNRHFDEMSEPGARRARRLLRRLDGIRRDLLAGGEVELTRLDGPADHYRIQIRFPALSAGRVALVTLEEYALLVDDAAVAELLRSLPAR